MPHISLHLFLSSQWEVHRLKRGRRRRKHDDPEKREESLVALAHSTWRKNDADGQLWPLDTRAKSAAQTLRSLSPPPYASDQTELAAHAAPDRLATADAARRPHRHDPP